MILSAGTVIERYRVESLLGAGGHGEVWKVRHTTLGQAMALKVIRTSSAALNDRLIQEGRLQAALRHPNLLAVQDVLDVGGSPGLLLEFIDGPSLQGLLAQSRLPREEALRLFEQIALGVGHAHEAGVVHRDLKPANVLLSRVGRAYQAKVADFGLAKVLQEDARMTRSGMAMGTLCYMAPEQVRNAARVDQRADIFALACILYEMLRGMPPIPATDLIQYYNAILTSDWDPLSIALPDIPPALEHTIAACLRPEPEARPQDVAAMLAMMRGEPMPSPLAAGGEPRERHHPFEPDSGGFDSNRPPSLPAAPIGGGAAALTSDDYGASFAWSPPRGDGGPATGAPFDAPRADTPLPAANSQPTFASFEGIADFRATSAAVPNPPNLAQTGSLPKESDKAPATPTPEPSTPKDLAPAAPPLSPPTGPVAPSRAAGPPWGMLGALLLGGLLVGGTLAVERLLSKRTESSVPAEAGPTIPSEAVPNTSQAPPVEDPAPPEPQPATPQEPPLAPSAPPSPAKAPRPETKAAQPREREPQGGTPETPERKPEAVPIPPETPAQATFSAQNPEYAVRLESGGGSFGPGQALPLGSYRITADFGEGRTVAGQAEIQVATAHIIKCTPAGGRCTSKPR
jgi:serine/threonine protein kinase